MTSVATLLARARRAHEREREKAPGLLLQAVIDSARERGCPEVGLYITHRHAANWPFYEKFGFEDVGVEVRQRLD